MLDFREIIKPLGLKQSSDMKHWSETDSDVMNLTVGYFAIKTLKSDKNFNLCASHSHCDCEKQKVIVYF